MFDKHEHNKTELHQINIGSGIVVGRDQIIHNHIYCSVYYQQLIADIKETD
jgi:hypothetical protein